MDILNHLVEKAIFLYSSSTSSKTSATNSTQSTNDTKSDVLNKETPQKIKPNILLVEDDLAIRIIYSEFLRRLNCACTTAASGEEALLFYPHADLVLLDISLPDVSGVEVCRRIRQQPDGKTLPIIAFTGLGHTVEAECYEAGFDHFALKPVSLAQLYSLLYNWLPAYRTVIQRADEASDHE